MTRDWDGVPPGVVEIRIGGCIVKAMGRGRPPKLPITVQAKHRSVARQPGARPAAQAISRGEVVEITAHRRVRIVRSLDVVIVKNTIRSAS
jgi:hypothetical protein